MRNLKNEKIKSCMVTDTKEWGAFVSIMGISCVLRNCDFSNDATAVRDIYKKGDIITFQKDNILVTHRIDEKLQNGFITKGDANNVPDTKEVSINDIVGKTLFVIPKAGKLVFYLRTPLGMALIIFAGFLLFEIPFLLNKKYEQGGEKIEI